MGLFGRKKDVVPDVGDEGLDEGNDDFFDGNSEGDDLPVTGALKRPSAGQKSVSVSGSSNADMERLALRFERIETRLTALDEYIKGYSERFSSMNQQIGEVRSMNMTNEKSLMKISVDVSKAVDLVQEVHPEKLQLAYEKMNVQVQTLNERIGANRSYLQSLMEEMKDFKRKSQVFIGTEGLIKMNNDIKKDLISLQKLAGRVKLNSDKTENIFMEIQKGFAEDAKVDAMVENLEKNYSGLKSNIEKVQNAQSKLVNQEDWQKMKVYFNNKIGFGDEVKEEMQKMKEENKRLAGIIEKLLLVSEENSEKIQKKNKFLSLPGGNEKKFESLLNLIDSLSKEVVELKKKVNPEKKEVYDFKGNFGRMIVKVDEVVDILNKNKKHEEIFRKVNNNEMDVSKLTGDEQSAIFELKQANGLLLQIKNSFENVYQNFVITLSEEKKDEAVKFFENFKANYGISEGLKDKAKLLRNSIFNLFLMC